MSAGESIKLSAPEQRGFWEVPVLFEDEHLLVLDKPAGLLTVPEPELPEEPALVALLHAGIAAGKPWAMHDHRAFLAPAQRLDADASGALVFGKSREVSAALADQFNAVTPLVEYLVLVGGTPVEDEFSVDARLMADPDRPGLMRLNPQGKKARTQFAVVQRFRKFTLLRGQPETERPHQLRLHLRGRRLPVVGDRDYRGPHLLLSSLKRDYSPKPHEDEQPLIRRAALHAAEVRLIHPVTGAALKIEAPLPKDFSVALKYLRRYAG